MLSAHSSLSSTSMLNASYRPNPRFVKKLSSKYLCTDCNQGLTPPVKQSACGHRFCCNCIENLLNNNEHSGSFCPGGEEGCDRLTSNTVYPDRGTDRELGSMSVFCDNYPQCSDVTSWRLLNDHVNTCRFTLILCPNRVYGCKNEFAVIEKENHLANHCRFTRKYCRFCGNEFSKFKLEQHEAKCKVEQVQCDYKDEGCEFIGKREEMTVHDNKSSYRHLELLRKHLQREKELSKELSARVEVIPINQSRIDEQVQALQKDQNDLQSRILVYQRNARRSIESESQKANEMTEDCKAFNEHKKKLKRLETRIENLEQKINRGQDEVHDRDHAQIKSHEKTIAMHDTVLAEYEIRFRCLETANYNGMLVWKITNYRQRKLAALEGRTLSIYSQPFYSHPYGYKMCARMYLNGDGLGRNTHASLYFVVMRGEYDSIMSWPFRQKVTMILMDQDTGRNHIQDTFRPDPTSSSFQKPANVMNIASGSPLFVSQSVLENGMYLKQDTIFIMLKVDVSDLNQFGAC